MRKIIDMSKFSRTEHDIPKPITGPRINLIKIPIFLKVQEYPPSHGLVERQINHLELMTIAGSDTILNY